MREKPQRKRPNKKTAGRSEARQENRPDRRKEAAGEAIEDNFVFGYHAVAEALKEGRGNKLFLSEEARGEKIDRLKEMAREQAVPVKWVPKQKLDTMSDQGVHQGMILAIPPYQYLTLDELLAQTKEQPLYLILDNLEDPHNFGSIMRTADASGVDGIIIPKHRAVGITPIVVKTSTGAVEHIPVARVTNLTQAVQQLKKAGFWILGTDMSGSDYRTWNAQGAVGLIIGNEGRGMGEGLKKEVDQMLTIPMTGHVQSLNASVAAGLLMYQAFTSRNGASQ